MPLESILGCLEFHSSVCIMKIALLFLAGLCALGLAVPSVKTVEHHQVKVGKLNYKLTTNDKFLKQINGKYIYEKEL